MAIKAAPTENMIEIRIRFFTDDIAPGKNIIEPKHAWDTGMVMVTANHSHGLKAIQPLPFHSLMDLPRAIEKVIIESNLTLHSAPRSGKYLAGSKHTKNQKEKAAA
jgi:hypothetical protein